jgi:hypothetical protein
MGPGLIARSLLHLRYFRCAYPELSGKLFGTGMWIGRNINWVSGESGKPDVFESPRREDPHSLDQLEPFIRGPEVDVGGHEWLLFEFSTT